MTLRVVGAGFGRTGTLSLKCALEELGFGPTYHMQEVMRRPSHVATWLRYARSGEVAWDDLFSDFESGVDFPVSCVWDQLAAHYPDAKVILTVRDPQAWWDSTASTIYGMHSMFPGWVTRVVPTTGRWVEMTDALVWDGLFDGQFANRDHAVAVFESHIARVRATCPPERLLVFDVAEGWEPLCAFLEVPLPSTPFPRLNDAKTVRRLITSVRWGTRAIPFMVAAAVVGRSRRRRKRGD
jgi:Sulfotransferase domain